MPAELRRWSTTEVREMQDESRAWPRYELIAGELVVTPAPGTVHQIAVAELLMVLSKYVDRENLGVALASPADLELRPGTIVQPDVFVVPRSRRSTPGKKRDWGAVTSLLVAIEVVSPGSGRRDRVTKRDYYLGVGVPEYWVVDLDARVLERWIPGDEHASMLRSTLEWRPTETSGPLIVSLPDLFERIWRKVEIISET